MPYGASLDSVQSRTYDFHQTPPRGALGASPPMTTRFSRPAPLSLQCQVPSVRALGLDFHLLSVAHAGRTSSRRPRFPGGTSHGTGQVLFTSGSSGQRVANPSAGRVTTSPYPNASVSWTGAAMGWGWARSLSTSETSPRSAKYALRSPRSTAGLWLNAQRDCRPR